MALSIRLSRGGRKKRPVYSIVVADKRMPRDGRYIEKLGKYNPLLQNDNEKRVTLVEERIKYWLSQGAKPSERVAIFLGKAGIIDMPAQPNRPKKSTPGEKAQLLIEEKEGKRKAAQDADKAAKAKAEAEEEAKKAEETPAEEEKTEEKTEEKPAEEAPAEEKEEEKKEAAE